ncbi:MAG: hypothetical protein OXR66_03450, partial [Candidatus Woesearchaeota archaeon]|nr:hypothetical protein [Candidatus Woesearchaeota archaeon]
LLSSCMSRPVVAVDIVESGALRGDAQVNRDDVVDRLQERFRPIALGENVRVGDNGHPISWDDFWVLEDLLGVASDTSVTKVEIYRNPECTDGSGFELVTYRGDEPTRVPFEVYSS